MGEGDADRLKGRAKEAVGDLTDNDRLENEGKVDRAAGGIKEKVSDFVDKVKDAVQRKS
jgi:uncharacterized protein YjbJ (UPF0337 family)